MRRLLLLPLAFTVCACGGPPLAGSSTTGRAATTSSASSGSASSSGTTGASASTAASTGSSGSTSASSSGGSTTSSSGSGSTASASGSASGSGSSSGSSGSSSSGSSSSGSSGSTGAVDAGIYTYDAGPPVHYCVVEQAGQRVLLADSDAGCLPAPPACAGEAIAVEPEVHVPEPMTVAYVADPPPSGPHWDCWAPWDQTHAFAKLRAERFVHNSEHGGVILLYRCDPDAGLPDGGACDAMADPVIQYASDGGVPAPAGDMRYLVTARPVMPTRYAALAWGWRLEFDDWDAGLVDCFATWHLGAAPENIGASPSINGCPQSYEP